MIVLALLITVIAGGAAYYFYCRSDEGLRQMVLRQLEATAPTLKFSIARAQWDMIGRVHIYGLTVGLPDDDDERPSIEIRKIEATLESRPLTDFDNVVIQKLRITNPKIRAVRSPDGAWNLKGISLHSTSSGPLPEVEIEHGTVNVEVQLPHRPARRLKFQHFNVSTVPIDSRRLAIQIGTLLEPAGPLTLDLTINLDGPKWECVSRDPWRVPVDSKLIHLLCDLSPDVATHVAEITKWIDDAKVNSANSSQANSPSQQAADASTKTSSSAVDFGLTCVCQVTFLVAQDGPGTPLEFRALTSITEGEINHELLPLPLRELKGNILIDPRRIVVSDVQATSGAMTLSFDGDVIPSKPIQGVLKLRGIELNDELKSRIPEKLRKVIQPLGMTGICNIDVSITHDSGHWKPKVDLTLKRATVTSVWFPVTVRNVEGELHLLNDTVTFNATGQYANQPVTVEGTVNNPGPDHQAEILFKSRNLPLDDESIDASPSQVQRAIKALNLTCRHDVWFRLTKPAGAGQKYRPELVDWVHDGRMSFNGFKYEIEELEALIKWNGEDVTFSKLRGIHSGATLVGHGSFRRKPGPGVLELAIEATDGEFDRSLKEALPEKLQRVWNDFQPQGVFDIATRIHWIPEQRCEIDIPTISVREGEIVMKSFAWSLEKLKGEFAFNTKTGELIIKEIHARHDDTQLSGSGRGSFPNGDTWRLKFNQLNIDNLVPNAKFRNALPQRIQRVYDSVQPKGDFSFHGPVEFVGSHGPDQTLSASWKLKTVLSQCSMNAGIAIDEINGVIQLDGSWDGTNAELSGQLNLDSISVFRKPSGECYRIPVIRGPFSLKDNVFVAGTRTALPPRKNAPPAEDRISGKVIGGTIYLDAIVDLAAESGYQVFVELEKGLLERYAQEYMQGQSHLAGVMNGSIILRGKGSGSERMVGEGRLRIAPAALYELPLFVQMFSLPQLRVPDKTAFEQADLKFTVANNRFDFQSIELIGDAMSLLGRGYIRFDGGLGLEFGSRPGRGRRRMLQNLFMGAELIAVRVTGNVGNPDVAYVPLPDLDDTFRQLLNPRPLMAPTGRYAPRTGQSSSQPNR
jgi:hypothetical protein